jgi:hypothetical protein
MGRLGIQYSLSEEDVRDVRKLLNAFLEHVSLKTLSRREAELADLQRRLIGSSHTGCPHIVKVVNRWGITNEDGQYNALLNGLMGHILSRHRLLQIYESIQLLVFRKMLEAMKAGEPPAFSLEEVQVFFLQPYEVILSESILTSSIHLNELVVDGGRLSAQLQSDNAREFLNQGVVRRLVMLRTSVDSMSRIYSHHRTQPLGDEEAAILSQNINFFYANVFAIVDCLAFVFAYEDPGYPIDRANTSDLMKVNLFSKEFRKQIRGLSEWPDLAKAKVWYDTIKELRHPVAHRIPLYFPEIYTADDSRAIQEIDQRYHADLASIVGDTAASSEDLADKLDAIRAERQKREASIGTFSGVFLHSDRETRTLHHLSRLTVDLGILYYLLHTSFDHLAGHQGRTQSKLGSDNGAGGPLGSEPDQ